MNVSTVRKDEEKMVLTGMIVSDEVSAKLYKLVSSQEDCFSTKWTKLVGRWCADYFGQYGRAPRQSIEGLFAKWAETSRDSETVEMVETFLSHLSDSYREKTTNVDFICDRAFAVFKKNALRRLAEGVEACVVDDDIDMAVHKVAGFLEVPYNDSSSIISVLDDDEAVMEAFDTVDVALINYPGALGKFFDVHLQRDGLISFLAPEKRGKSFWLIDVAWRSVLQRRNTLFYSAGDMSQSQMMRRFGVRASRRPWREGTYGHPLAIRRDGQSSVVKREKREVEGNLSPSLVKKAFAKTNRKTGSKTGRLRMKCTPNSTTSVADIRADLLDLARSGWVPDVVVVDYADILASEPGTSSMDTRHSINETWKALRRLSQEFHILVVTATQSDALGADAEVLGRRHFSEDKRKAAHVTGMIGLNQTNEEKEMGVYRLNWIYLREGKYVENRVVRVAGSLELVAPAMVSCF